jgi:exonuclease SbcC
MKIEKLRLKGFTGIKKGLGLDEIEIDFSNINGLVAFEGMNGTGKSSVLENLHAYNQLVSRDGALYQHVETRDAEKELSFTYGGHHYRTLLKIDCQSQKSEGWIWKDGKSEVNGKISAYAKYIKDLLGSPALFFASVFCAQNSAKLSDMTTGELKGLFSEFLRLDRLQEYEGTAKNCANVLNGKLGTIDARIAGLKEKMAGKDNIEEQRYSLGQKVSFFTDDKTEAELNLEDKKKQVEQLKETISKNTLLIQRKADLQATIERLQKELDADKTTVEAEIEALKTKWKGLAGEVAKCNEVLKDKDAIMGAADREKEINAEIERLSVELDGLTKEVSDHQGKIHGMEAIIAALKQKIKDLDNDTELARIDKEIADLNIRITEQKNAIADTYKDREEIDLTNKVLQCEDKTAALKLKDPACKSSTCSFIVGALAARDELPKLKAELTERMSALEAQRTEYNNRLDILNASFDVAKQERESRLSEIEKEKKKLSGEDQFTATAWRDEKDAMGIKLAATTQTRQDIARLRLDLTKIKELAAKQAEVQLAEFRLTDLQKAQDDITAQGKEKRQAWDEREFFKKIEIDDQQRIVAAISDKIDGEAEGKLKTVQAEIETIEKVTLPGIEKKITETRDKIAALQSELSRMADAEKELETVQAERNEITQEIAEWTYLRNACGKNGLQALEIDGAAPLITGYANDLLSQAFGPLFTVKFRTQDDEGKECLDIVVIGEDGEDVLLENLSGGQRIWILMALRLAMTLLSKEKSGRNFETAFFDEMDGALDPDNSTNFIGLYQAFMKTGGFSMLPFISHKPSCRSMADNILIFKHGQNPAWGG